MADILGFKLAIAEQARKFIKSVDKCIGIISDSDADGICSAAIMTKALTRKNIPFQISFLIRSESNVENILKSKSYSTWLFMDFGGREVKDYAAKYPDRNFFVLDHHKAEKVDLPNVSYINPADYGLDGGFDLCASSIVYVFAVELDKINEDLSYIAVGGIIGDSQAKDEKISEFNCQIVERAEDLGIIVRKKGIKFYGWNSRPIHKALEYSVDPFIPGVSGSESAAIQFLQEIGINLKTDDGKWKKFADLNEDEKKRLATALIMRRQNKSDAGNIFGNKLFFPKFPIDELREGEVFASWINSISKQGYFSIAVSTALGGVQAYESGKKYAEEYKKLLMQGLSFFYDNRNNSEVVTETENAIYFFGKEKLDPELVSTISTILSHSLTETGKTIFCTAYSGEKLKVSARIIGQNVKERDLSIVLNKIATKFGGEGGGHKPAAGALIPKDKENLLIQIAEESFING